jgi:hypothetical protein
MQASWKEAAWVFGLSRLIILLISYLSVTFLPKAPITGAIMLVGPKCTNNVTCFFLSWWRWDAIHYVQIAYGGYNQKPLTAFFPLFPLFMHGIGFLFGGSEIADYAAGLILANSCFYVSLVLFYYLVTQDFGPRVARYALVYLAFAPYAIFFFVGYAESLFLLLTLAFFYFLRRGNSLDWWLAGLCGFLAALTRPTGVALIIPFLVLFVQKFGIYIDSLPIQAHWQQKLNALLPLLLIPAGLLIYLLYQWKTFGNPWLFTVEEAYYWQRSFSFPWMGFFYVLREIVTAGPLAQWCLNDAVFTLWPLVSLIIGWKLLSLEYRLFSAVMILFVLCEPSRYEGLLSAPRFMIVVFPIFLLFALWSQHPRVTWYFMVPSVLFFVVHVMQFAVYWWVA